ncbi:MAG: putative ABC transporter permease [Bacilli bacterium]|nr:putative ABC transporter permease [Bacilli bacterium]
MKQLLGKSYILKLIWIFVLGSVFGYFIETGYYYLKHGVFLNKQGLLYGPIKPIYGFGAIIITLLLSAVINKSKLKVFIYGCFIGGAFEYICSLVLEYMFNTKMWHYRSKYLSIGGRVYLIYLPFWGLAALLWVYAVIPWFNKVFDKINLKVIKVLSIIVTAFLVFDFSISIIAVQRMRSRQKGIPATNAYERYLDKHYNDKFIMKRLPYIRIVK